MRRLLMLAALAGLMPALLLAQEKGKVEPIKIVELKRDTPVLYDKDIEPLFVKKCLVCHSGQVKEGKLDLDTYEGLMKGGKRGKAVIPAKGDESLLYKSCRRIGEGSPPMPPPKEVNQQPLSPDELALLKLWIDQGAKAPTGIRTRPMPVVTAPPASVKPVHAVAVSADKTLVAAGRGNQIHIYEGKDGKYLRTLLDKDVQTPDKKPVQAAHLSLVESLAFSPDGKLLVSGSFQEVKIWDPESGELKQKLTGFADRVVTLAFSSNGKLLATGGGAATEDGEVKVFDMPEGKLLVDIKQADPKNNHSDTVFGVCFSPDGSKLASCGADKFVKVFEIPSGKFLKSFEGHTHHVMSVGWKADGKLLASAGGDSPSAISPGPGVIKVWDYEKGEQVRPINNAHARQITQLLFVGATNTVITCSGDGSVKIFNVDNGGATRTFQAAPDFLYSVGTSADGTVVAAGCENGTVRLYNGTNGQLVKTLAAPGEEEPPPPKK
jgi:Planctomycete cytochrome C/WD domain, G-beta repeat